MIFEENHYTEITVLVYYFELAIFLQKYVTDREHEKIHLKLNKSRQVIITWNLSIKLLKSYK